MMERCGELTEKSYKLGELSPGSIQTRWVTCGSPDCRCKRGEKHGPYYYLSYKDRKTGKMKHLYIKQDQLDDLEERIKNYEKFKDELWELVEIEAELRKG